MPKLKNGVSIMSIQNRVPCPKCSGDLQVRTDRLGPYFHCPGCLSKTLSRSQRDMRQQATKLIVMSGG